MSGLKCPRDGEILGDVDMRTPSGVSRRIQSCTKCGGILLKKEDISTLFASGLSAHIIGTGNARCPGCGKLMKLTKVKDTEVDICSICGLVWLDRGELNPLMEREGGKVLSYEAKTDGNALIMRIDSGSDLFAAIQEACAKNYIESGIIVAGIGQLRDFELGYMKVDKYVRGTVTETMELLSLQGSVAPITVNGKKEASIHAHAVLSNEGFEVTGGHLFGAKVGAMAEVTLLRVYGMTREELPSGLKMLRFR